MRPLTDTMPKPLLCVRGKPLIERHVEHLVQCGIDRIVINLAWLGSMIREYLGDGAHYGAHIRYSEETPQALETAGGIFRALPMLGSEPFLVVNGDILTNYAFARLTLAAAHDAGLVLVPNPPHHARGDFGLQHGLCTAAPEVGAVGSARYTFSGIAVYRPSFFSGCADGSFPLKPLLLRSIAAKSCAGELFEGVWEDVGTPQRLAALNA